MVLIKDLVKGAAFAIASKSITDRDEFQARKKDLQHAVKRGDLVETVRKALVTA